MVAVYLQPFAYHAPASLEEALALLRAHLPDAKVLAGGQSLLPLMNLGLARPAVLVDVNGLPGLDRVVEADGGLRIGALTRHRALETSPVVRRACPLLAEAAGMIGNIRVRHRGTIGGSLAHADPAAELPVAVTALGGTVEVRGPEGAREVAAEEFFQGYLATDLAPGEIVTGVRVPALGRSTGYGLVELVRRAGDFAVVAACAVVTLDDARRCERVSLVLGGVGPRPCRIRAAEALLAGRVPADQVIGEAADAVPDEIAPEPDIHASAEYRRAMARVMARRALRAAAARAGGAPDARA